MLEVFVKYLVSKIHKNVYKIRTTSIAPVYPKLHIATRSTDVCSVIPYAECLFFFLLFCYCSCSLSYYKMAVFFKATVALNIIDY